MNENETMEVVKVIEAEAVKPGGKIGKIVLAVTTVVGVGIAIGVTVKHMVKGKKHVTKNLDDMKRELETQGATVTMPDELESASVSEKE